MEFKSANVRYIPIEKLEHHPNNPRKDLGDLSELSDSIKKNGVFQNLTVVPAKDNPGSYYVVIGNRRMEASKTAGLSELPCIVSDMTENEQAITMLAENMQRNDLSVFEQAVGFQYAMDLGETVKTLSEKSGFSERTVKKRIKLAEFDQEKLKKVSERQISIADLDALSGVEDIEERNRILLDIGTANFSYRLKSAIDSQRRKKKEEKWEKFFLAAGLKRIPHHETHSGKYGVPKKQYFVLDSCSMDDLKLDKEIKYFSINYGSAYFRRDKTEKERTAESYRTTDEREREYRCELLLEIKKRCYELRRGFIFSISESKAKELFKVVLEMVMIPEWDSDLQRAYYCRYLAEKFFNSQDQEEKQYPFEEAVKRIQSNPFQSLLRHAYVALGDGENIGYHNWMGDHIENERLTKIYDFLERLGYSLADEEAQYKDGTHKLFEKEKTDE